MSLARKRRIVREHTFQKGGRINRNTRNIRKIQRVLKQIELKFIDSVLDLGTITATGNIAPQLFTIPQGDLQSTRDGRKVHLTSVQWQGTIHIDQSVSFNDASDTVRLLMVIDKQTNGSLPAITDLIVNNNWESFKNLENQGRFRVILDKFISVNSMGAQGDGTTASFLPVEKHFKVFRKLSLNIEYNDLSTSGAIGTITTNNVVILLISRNANASIESCIRFRYTDL